jgi:pimeloyl-ACP methyl ester carboxylesterase
MRRIFERFWHKTLKRPYKPAVDIDEGSGEPVLLLHGVGASAEVWQPLVKLLANDHRVLAFDLLGFGNSPKPDWPDYNADDHAKSILAGLKRRKVRGPVTIVGHSMGCLVAVHIARLKPKLVKRLILYEMPLYTERPELKRYTMLRKLYLAAYSRVLKYPAFTQENANFTRKLAARLIGFKISEETWPPYVRSLQNTILSQTTADDMLILDIPIDIIYGSRDIVILRGAAKAIFTPWPKNMESHTVRARHVVTPRAAEFIAKRLRLEPLEAPD